MLESSRRGMPRLTSGLRLVVTVGICSAAGLSAVSLASAQSPAQPGASAVQQYAEDVPTANGQSTPGITNPAAQPLSAAALRALRRSTPATAAALRTIATLPAYGAPKTGAADVGLSHPSYGSSLGGSLGSTADAIDTVSDAPLVGLLLVLIATSMGALVLAARRGRT